MDEVVEGVVGIMQQQVLLLHIVEDGSYMRLKVLQIGYSLPGQMLQRVGVKRCV